MFNVNEFIERRVTGREVSMFEADVKANADALRKAIKGRSLLVIGGAGTIGCSFIKAVLPFEPASLVVVDINENGLTELTRDLRSGGNYVPCDYLTYPMNYADTVFEKMFCARGGFDIVANFSAHKHVRSERDLFSVQVLLQNNVIKARRLLELMVQYPPQHFFCVSTDKAANPVNIMGGSKKMMEDMAMAYSTHFPITTARFANVAFSNGSLPAGFLMRIENRQPISAPSDVTRYFVSPIESGQICMLACMLGRSGEIFFPKLDADQVMTFSAMATELLSDMGYSIYECDSESEAIEKAKELNKNSKNYPVYFSKSDTTGEKPYEEFVTTNESVDISRYNSLGVVTNVAPRPMADIDDVFEKLNTLFDKNDVKKSEIVAVMKSFLGNFDHVELERNLDNRM